MLQNISTLPISDISKLEDLLFTHTGLIQPVPYATLSDFPQEMISQFCVENGVYQIPTTELIDFLKAQIGESVAIEIGAGNGCIGRALGIKMVDNYLQDQSSMKQHYKALNQPTVKYGLDVVQNDALRAVKIYKPEIVIGCWITNKVPGGISISDIAGIEERLLFKNGVKKYIHVGNLNTHRDKPILNLFKVRCFYPPWLLSRSMYKEGNVIYIFER